MLDLRYSNFGNTIFSTYSALAQEHNAIDLTGSYPDIGVDPLVIEAFKSSVDKSLKGFSHVHGLPELRQNIADKYRVLFGKGYSAETDITVTSGYTQALFSSISALIREGDEVILFEPSHDNYVSMVEVNGGRPVFASLKPGDFSIDWDAVQKMVTPQTRLIIINTPHNPTGSLLTELDMLRLQKLISGTKIVVLSDELFDYAAFDGALRQSVSLYPKLAEKSIIVSSIAEAHRLPGWQLGYVIAPEAITKEIRKHQQIMIYSVSSPLQHTFAQLPFEKSNYLEHANVYQQKRDYLIKGLENSLFTIVPSAGTYFQLLGYDKISKESDKDFAVRLIKENGVALLPISVFYHEKTKKSMLRLNFAQPDSVLDEVILRLNSVGR